MAASIVAPTGQAPFTPELDSWNHQFQSIQAIYRMAAAFCFIKLHFVAGNAVSSGEANMVKATIFTAGSWSRPWFGGCAMEHGQVVGF